MTWRNCVRSVVDAERKYYTNLHELQEKVARLEAVQILRKLLVVCTDPADAIGKLIELSIQYMGVEKALVALPAEDGCEIDGLKGYSRRQAG